MSVLGGILMKKESVWHVELTAPVLLLLPAAIGINYIGKLFAQLLNLPLWLDATGTFLACMLGGPIIGSLAGLINNVLYGFLLDPVSFIYGLTSVAMGLTIGILSYKGFLSNWRKALQMGVAVALIAAVVSTPINVVFWGGSTGNIWGDFIFNLVMRNTSSIWAASFSGELLIDLPDKIIMVLISYIMYKSLPKSVLQFYVNGKK